ncbi:TetR/AcrR family transcriptional regulator [Opitutaceae bacterium EW11]|nr:TetR/AcrR family transcriptional regulator [Opitutaceae bacterium EW11]
MPRHCDSRERLLKAASDLMWRGSYNATSVDQICEACGIKKGSFYHHFTSKEELTLEALEQKWAGFKAMLDTTFSPLHPPLERFQRFLAADREFQQSTCKDCGFVCGCPMFSLGSEIGTLEPAIREKVSEILGRLEKYFESAIREAHALGQIEAPDAASLAWQVLTLYEGAVTLARIRNDFQPIETLEAGLFRLLGAKAAAIA